MLDFYYITSVGVDGKRVWWDRGWSFSSFKPYFRISDAQSAMRCAIEQLPTLPNTFREPGLFARRAEKILNARVVGTHSEGGLPDGTTCVIHKPISHEEQKAFTDSIETRLAKSGYTREWIESHLELGIDALVLCLSLPDEGSQ